MHGSGRLQRCGKHRLFPSYTCIECMRVGHSLENPSQQGDRIGGRRPGALGPRFPALGSGPRAPGLGLRSPIPRALGPMPLALGGGSGAHH